MNRVEWIKLRKRSYMGRLIYTPRLFLEHMDVGRGRITFSSRLRTALLLTKLFLRKEY